MKSLFAKKYLFRVIVGILFVDFNVNVLKSHKCLIFTIKWLSTHKLFCLSPIPNF